MEDYFIFWIVFWIIVGSFGTAYIHQKTGRDVQMGGLIGAVVGGIGQIFLLAILWVWLYYGSSWRGPRMYGTSRRVWYRWWE